MIGGNEQEIVLTEAGANGRQCVVELAQGAHEPGHIATMAVQSVEIYKVGKEQPTLGSGEPLENGLNALSVVSRVPGSQRPAGEEVVHLPHACTRDPCTGE